MEGEPVSPQRLQKEGTVNRKNSYDRSQHILMAAALALYAVAMASPVTTACAVGTASRAAWQGRDGYGTAWFVDPGEWYLAPAAPVPRASKAELIDDGYGTAWFVDPGEWFVAPATPVAQASGPVSGNQEEAGTWYVDPGEWYPVQDEYFAIVAQGGSPTP
jgi:hypothetical protein